MLRPFRRLRAGAASLAILAAVFATALTGSGASPAAADTSTCSPTGTISAGDYLIQANEWNSSAQQCLTYTSGTAWSVSTANFGLGTSGAPATYPSIYKGCHWGVCTANSGMPIQVSNLGSAVSSWSTTQPGSGAYDVAYDIWFNSTPTTTGQPDGTEMMIWLNSRGGVSPFGSQTATTTINGNNWAVWTGQQTSWKIISYRLNPGGTSFSNLDIKALISDAVARGSLNPAHYLIDAEAGFEIWQGGQGLATNSFSFTATAGTGGGDTTPPSVPANLAVTGTTSSSASLSWSASTDNVGVAGYRVYRNGTQVGTTAGTSFTDSGLNASTQYSYTVAAYDAAGNVSSPSSAVSATTVGGGGDTTPPSTPANLAVTGTTASSASLSWSASTDNVGVAGYRIYRGGTQIGTSTSTSFTDTGLKAATQYSYTVAAYDAAGNVSATSSAVTATTQSGSTGGGGGCTATYTVSNQWSTGFTANVTVTNTGTSATSSWKVGWTWGGNQAITNLWNGTESHSGSAETVTNANYNGSLAAGGNTSFGFQASYSGSNGTPTLTCTAS